MIRHREVGAMKALIAFDVHRHNTRATARRWHRSLLHGRGLGFAHVDCYLKLFESALLGGVRLD